MLSHTPHSRALSCVSQRRNKLILRKPGTLQTPAVTVLQQSAAIAATVLAATRAAKVRPKPRKTKKSLLKSSMGQYWGNRQPAAGSRPTLGQLLRKSLISVQLVGFFLSYLCYENSSTNFTRSSSIELLFYFLREICSLYGPLNIITYCSVLVICN